MGKVDVLVVGQGIAGSILAHQLIRAGMEVLVIDDGQQVTSSYRAAGIYNPVTGRQAVLTWMASALFSYLEAYYPELERTVDAHFFHPKTIYRPFHSIEDQNEWQGKVDNPSLHGFIEDMPNRSLGIHGVQDEYGGLLLRQSGYVDLPVMLKAVRQWLQRQGVLLENTFVQQRLQTNGTAARYENITARWVVRCEGVRGTQASLPYRPVRGDLLHIKTNLPEHLIINRGVFILPRGGTHLVGSTYDHQFLDFEPREKGVQELKTRLSTLYQGDYELVSTSAGVRPATYDRKPFIGKVPESETLVVFNGFGTKGVSLIPFFAEQLVNYLSRGEKLMDEVSISRIKGVT